MNDSLPDTKGDIEATETLLKLVEMAAGSMELPSRCIGLMAESIIVSMIVSLAEDYEDAIEGASRVFSDLKRAIDHHYNHQDT